MISKLTAAFLCSSFAVAMPTSAQAAPASSSPAGLSEENVREFEQGLTRAAGGPFILALKRLFPADYSVMLKELIERAAMHLNDEPKLRALGFEVAERIFRMKLPDVVNAPAPSLAAINARQLDLVRALRPNHAEQCAQYVTDGFDSETQLPADLHAQSVEISVAMLEAAKVGGEIQKNPARGSMDLEAAKTWVAKMNELAASDRLRFLIANDNALAAASAVEKCQIGELIFAAVAQLPPEQAAGITAFLLVSSTAN